MIGMRTHNFSAAGLGEATVFGASCPGYSKGATNDPAIEAWVGFMKEQGVARVCCLLSPKQVAAYPRLLEHYRTAFSDDDVCWAPIKDFELCSQELLIEKILPFLRESKRNGKKVVVHCQGGIGRTGHILAAWLAAERDLEPREAVKEVRRTAASRDPLEAVGPGAATKEQLYRLLRAARELS